MTNFLALIKKSVRILRSQGLTRLLIVSVNYVRIWADKRAANRAENKQVTIPHCDILFINGCDYSLPHPIRYRVYHQIEQLAVNNIFCHIVYHKELTLDYLRYARGFVIFRCPYSEIVGRFIEEAKKLNKHVFFDIDDMVVDTKYTDMNSYVRNMEPEAKKDIDDGVRKMGQTLCLCDSAITTTEALAAGLEDFVPEVFINRNVASDEMMALSIAAIENEKKGRISHTGRRDKVVLGYFSGSITHNEDFELILSTLLRVLSENKNVYLMITGILDIPSVFKEYKNRIIIHSFLDWKSLPGLIASIDINLAPLTPNLFNACKSENKWVEAALVKVPTIASDIGAFSHMIENGVTGILCSSEDEWYEALSNMINDSILRTSISERAFEFCSKNCLAIYTGIPLSRHIMVKLKPSIFFVMPSLHISGGVYVALKHAAILRERGFDITLMDMHNEHEWYEFEGYRFPVLDYAHPKLSKIDCCVATMWTTVELVESYPQIKKRLYLVQGFETDFYPPAASERGLCNRTYNLLPHVQIITVSKWCQNWLRDDFGKAASYVPNGLDVERFYPVKREFEGKVRILVEGNCNSHYKKVDESFEITNELNSDEYEVWYLSYNAKPKKHYRIDKFLHKVPFEEVSEVYRSCDILLKSSALESFSYPPLEMMATGGFVVIAPNGGNEEFLVDGYNCLLYEPGNVNDAIHKIEMIRMDSQLRDCLFEGGQETARSRSWELIKDEIVELYTTESANERIDHVYV